MNDKQIKYMVDRFLGWRLPEHFNPDAGISFKPDYNVGTPYPRKHEPVGTNLFCADQAEEMVRYLVDGMPPSDPVELDTGRQVKPHRSGGGHWVGKRP